MAEKTNPFATEAEKMGYNEPIVSILKTDKECKFRMLPNLIENKLPFFRYRQHYVKVNVEPIYIFHDSEKPCCMCDYANSLWNEDDEKNERYGLFKSKIKYDTYVIDRADSKIKLLIAHGLIYPAIIALAKKYGPPENVDSGFDIELKLSKKGKYADYKLIPDKEPSPLTKAEIALLKTQPAIDSLRIFTPEEKIKEILENFK